MSTPAISSFPYTFSTIIEADHASIQTLARTLTSKQTPYTTILSLLPTLIARLIRHDISEELVMRPAFTRYLDAERGAEAAEQDRADHADLKAKLMGLYARVVRGEFENGVRDGNEGGEQRLREEVKTLAVEMGWHMDEESGRVLPLFEKRVGTEVGLTLGREYARTLVLTVDVETEAEGDVGEGSDVEGKRRRRFESLEEYARAEIDVFKEILEALQGAMERGVDRGYFERRIREEVKGIGLDLGSNATSTLLTGSHVRTGGRGVSGKL